MCRVFPRSAVYFSFALVLCLSLTLTGCGLQDLLGNKKKSSTPKSSNQQPIIGVVLSENDPNQALIKKGIDDMAKKEGMKVNYLSARDLATAAQGEQGSQKGQKQGQDEQQGEEQNKGKGEEQSQAQAKKETGSSGKALQGVKAFIYQGADNPAVLQSVQEQKIPLVVLGQVPPGSRPAGVITPDREKAGELMAQSLVNKVSEGNVLILQTDPGDSGSQELLAGNRSVLGKYPKLNVTVIAEPAGAESMARQALADYLQKNPGRVQGVLAHTERLAAQAYEVLKAAQLEKKIVLVGGEANPQSLQRMAVGAQVADIDNSPYLQGVNAYQWAAKLLKKESLDVNDSVTGEQGEIPAKVVPVKAVTADNLAVVQKSYTKALTAAEEQQTKGQNQQGAPEGKQGTASKEQGQSGSDKAGGPGSPGKMPAGVNKVTERVKTEIIREYLDAQGKVIGTERSANEQVRTVPPEMLQQQAGQEQKKEQQTGEEKDKGAQDKDKGAGGSKSK